jgi:hypothetical protein
VLDYSGFFVGGFVYNDSSITISDVHVQAICGQVSKIGLASDGAGSAERQYHADVLAAERAR